MVKKFTRRLALLVSGIGLSLSAGAQYCTPTESGFSCGDNAIIAGFSTTGGTTNISNVGSGCNPGYVAGQKHAGAQGSTVQFSITAGDLDGTDKIWVDWNQDLDFNDAGEEVFTGSAFAYNTTNGNFVIPASATFGNTRMRVRFTYYVSDYYTACDYQEYSEYEDYDFTVAAPCTPPTLSTVVTNAACNGGSNGAINLTAAGSGSYSYVWSDGATTEDRTGLTAGNYSVTVSEVGNTTCQATTSATVIQPSLVSGNTFIYNVSCFGGSNGAINLTPTGGTTPYTFQWNNNATTEDRTGLTANTYSVTITDNNGCTGVVSGIVVDQPVSAVSGSGSHTNVSCYGGSNGTASVTAFGGTGGYTYLWSNGATAATNSGLTAGTYSVTITDANSCTHTVSNINITQPPAITVTGSQTNPTCNANNGSASVIVSGGAGGTYSYAWYPSGGTGATANNLAPNNYTAFIFDNNGCSASKGFTINADPNAVTPHVYVMPPGIPAICYGSPATFTTPNTDVNGGTYTWSRNGVVIPNETGTTLTLSDISKYKPDTIAVSVTGITGCVTTDIAADDVIVQASATPNPSVTASGSKNFCEGGSVTLANSVNASSSYGFSWMDANNTEVSSTFHYTATQSGTYTLSITELNTECTRIATPQVVTVKPLPVVNASADGALTLCPTGSVILSNSIAETGATYRWKKDGVTNVSTTSSYTAKTTGSYALTATLSGCSVTSPSFGVVVKAVPDAAVTTNGSTALCPGTSVLFSVANVAGYTYQWYNGANPITNQTSNEYTATAAGSYKVAIINGSCPAKNSNATSVTITNLAATITQTASSASSVTLRGNNGTVYGYQWYLNNSPIANATSQTYVATVNGSYTLELSRNGCTAMSSVKTVGGITPSTTERFAVEEEAQQAISVYPNPSEGIFNIASEEAVNVIVRDVQGKMIVNLTNAAQVDLTNQAAGMYLMQIMDANGTLLQNKRLMKK